MRLAWILTTIAYQLTVKARGQAITTDVDAVEITRYRFMKDLSIRKITVGTEEISPRKGENKTRIVTRVFNDRNHLIRK